MSGVEGSRDPGLVMRSWISKVEGFRAVYEVSRSPSSLTTPNSLTTPQAATPCL